MGHGGPAPDPGRSAGLGRIVGLNGRRAGCEAETRLADVQALERRLALKARDGDVDVVVLIVADTAHNRAVLERERGTLRALLPLEGATFVGRFVCGSCHRRAG